MTTSMWLAVTVILLLLCVQVLVWKLYFQRRERKGLKFSNGFGCIGWWISSWVLYVASVGVFLGTCVYVDFPKNKSTYIFVNRDQNGAQYWTKPRKAFFTIWDIDGMCLLYSKEVTVHTLSVNIVTKEGQRPMRFILKVVRHETPNDFLEHRHDFSPEGLREYVASRLYDMAEMEKTRLMQLYQPLGPKSQQNQFFNIAREFLNPEFKTMYGMRIVSAEFEI